MLTFPDEWRFGSPGGAPEGVKPLLSKLISVIAATNQRETYETFKSNFAAALGEASSRSSSTSWAETDMIEYFERSSAANEALFIQAFYDSCEQLRATGVPVPGVTHLNRLLADGESRYHLDPPRLTRADEPVEASSAKETSSTPMVPEETSTLMVPEETIYTPIAPSSEEPPFSKPTCFVIQPFDKGPFDKRFAEVLKPAIRKAGLKPYRVDEDDSADVPVESIEEGIRSAVVCLADISTDNPNVWYELGFAYASGTPVVMVCSESREGKKYPFDIQHRKILPYRADSISDFEALGDGITRRLQAAMRKGATIRQLADTSQVVAPVAGLSQPEMSVLAVLAGSLQNPSGIFRLWNLRQDCERAQVTAFGVNLALRKLQTKDFIRIVEEEETEHYGGGTYDAVGTRPFTTLR